MAWDANVTEEALTQDVDSDIYELPPAGTAHVQIERDPTGASDLILAQIFSVLEDVPADRDEVPVFAFGLRGTEDSISFILRGVWGFVVQILNGNAVPTGTVKANLRFKRDGIDVST